MYDRPLGDFSLHDLQSNSQHVNADLCGTQWVLLDVITLQILASQSALMDMLMLPPSPHPPPPLPTLSSLYLSLHILSRSRSQSSSHTQAN